MKRLIIFCIISCFSLYTHAALKLEEVRTASNNVIAVYFNSTIINANEVNTTASQWTVNGQQVASIDKYVMQAHECEHHIYLAVPQLTNMTSYELKTPYGDTTFVFDDHAIFCEAIKTNQAAYSALCKNNYALFAIWLGTGGSKQISGALPTYEVFETYTKKVVASGTLTEVGSDASSGDFVYRIDLSAVPEGGPYKIAVKGYGCSYPFGVGADFSRRLAYTIFRGQYYMRCGIGSLPPFTLDIRKGPCHVNIYDIDCPVSEASCDATGAPASTIIKVYGGYHDAGDTDRRSYHLANPIVDLGIYEAFPDLFTDGQFDIPDKFDSTYTIIGKGNGIPDIIDEAAWGTLSWEILQNANGSIHYGTNCVGYPSPFDAPFDQDKARYGTMVPTNEVPAVCAGLFLHLARLLRPYDSAHAARLVERSQRCFTYSGDRIAAPERLYYYVQKYLYDGDEAAHAQVKALQNTVDNYKNSLWTCPGYSLNNNAFDNPAYIIGYMVEKKRPVDSAVVEHFKAAIKAAADVNINEFKKYAYPIANNPNGGGWGHNVMQPMFAWAPILYWRFAKEQSYFDYGADILNYIVGLNPIGISYVTGIGFHQVYYIHDRESAYTEKMEWGPVPGKTVFGPGVSPSGTTVPGLGSLPKERQYCDNRACISINEFTIFETMAYNAVYAVLTNGGKWDPSKDPFASQQNAAVKRAPAATVATAPSPTVRLRDRTLCLGFWLAQRSKVHGVLAGLNGRVLLTFDLGTLEAGQHRRSFALGEPVMQMLKSGVLVCAIKGNGLHYSTVLCRGK